MLRSEYARLGFYLRVIGWVSAAATTSILWHAHYAVALSDPMREEVRWGFVLVLAFITVTMAIRRWSTHRGAT
jgi:hypothetical protein